VQQYCFSALRIFFLNAFIYMRCDEGHLSANVLNIHLYFTAPNQYSDILIEGFGEIWRHLNTSHETILNKL